SPAARWGANPPAIPKLMIPVAPRLAAASSEATSCDAWLQITATPGPSAMRASSARQVTATTCPRVDIQSSFCSRSAPWCRVNNLPQNVKLVNGLNPDLPVRPPRFRARAPLDARCRSLLLAHRRPRVPIRNALLGNFVDSEPTAPLPPPDRVGRNQPGPRTDRVQEASL